MQKNPFSNHYLNLGEKFYQKVLPSACAKPELIIFNEKLAAELGLAETELCTGNGAEVFSGNIIPQGAEPLAMAYSGHQFGYFNPQLGDGRAILLGDITGQDEHSYDLQLKGSGRTPYSRDGDGRSALGPVLREYLVSEAMAKLGVPTTRALAAVTTGESVIRQSRLPGGIITRIATSFVRVGTFEYFAANRDAESTKALADFMIERSYPRARQANNPYVALFEAISERQAALIAKWMHFGFIHGVMNTDNVSIAGETIDYGPCAFMDDYAHDRVFSSIDRNRRYAYGNQSAIGQWNMTRLAETFIPLLADEPEEAVRIAQDILQNYNALYQQYWLVGMREKIGLLSERDDDKELIEDLLNIMEKNQADFTLTFYYLSTLSNEPKAENSNLTKLYSEPEQIEVWLEKWRARLR